MIAITDKTKISDIREDLGLPGTLDNQEVTSQYICVPVNEFGRAAQHYALLETIRCADMTDAYNVSHVVSAVIAALNELEGRSPC